ncbi:hypothetical protein BH18ACT11_BH18ACT11_20660 [soil metagenome]
MGAGETTVDLTGDYTQSFDASIEGGIGEATVMLPSDVGVRVRAEGGVGKINAEGLTREGDSYVNDAYGNLTIETGASDFELDLGGIRPRWAEWTSAAVSRKAKVPL